MDPEICRSHAVLSVSHPNGCVGGQWYLEGSVQHATSIRHISEDRDRRLMRIGCVLSVLSALIGCVLYMLSVLNGSVLSAAFSANWPCAELTSSTK